MPLIAIIPGDGIGPRSSLTRARASSTTATSASSPLELWQLDLGADRYLRDGTTFPKEVAERITNEASAVLLGALGDPRVPDLEHARDILFGLRFGLDLYANMRPVKALADRLVPLKERTAKDVDFVVFRENTEGIYVGIGGQFKRGTPDEVAINEDINTRKGVERIIRAALRATRKQHGKKTVHMADKSNAMRHAHELWQRCFFEVAKEYPGIEAKHVYVDALCLYLVQDPRRSRSSSRTTCSATSSPTSARRCRAASAWRRARTSTRRTEARRDVRAGARLGPAARRQGPREPDRELPHRGHDARAPRLARGGDAHRVAYARAPSRPATARRTWAESSAPRRSANGS